MINYKKDDFDENLDDIMNSINGILSKNKVGYEVKEDVDRDVDISVKKSEE